MPIRPIGHLIKADANGVLPRIGGKPHASWSPVLDDITDQLENLSPKNPITVIVCGSVAHGACVNEAADLDLVILHGPSAT